MQEQNLIIASEELWQRAIALLREVVTTDQERSQMERYVPLLVSHSIENNEFVVGLSDQLQVDFLSPKLALPLERALHASGLPKEIRVRFAVKEGHENQTTTTPSPELARRRSAKGPGRTSYNPLFIYGGTGLGKTHLMEAIGHYVLDNSPSSSVCFITSETFLNEYVNAIQNDSLVAFRDRYRKVDVLLLDDVQFIAGKEKVQEEFFNTFNSLILYHKQIVITSDVSPKNLNRFEERLIGRFQQGMVVEIESPSYETRLAILKSKAQATQKIIPEEILKFIAENIRSHVRAIEGALARIVTFMSMQNDIPLTVEIAKHLLRDSIEEEKTIKDLSISDIMKTVATFYGVTIEDILSLQRTQTLVTPRQLAMFLSRKLTTKSLQEIADEFKKTHATVLHGAQAIQKRLDVEPELKKSMEEIVSRMGRKASDILE